MGMAGTWIFAAGGTMVGGYIGMQNAMFDIKNRHDPCLGISFLFLSG